MKRSILVFMVLLAATMILAVPRNLCVVEIGTGTWCTYCPGAAMGADDLIENGHAVAIVENHNGDNYANTYSNARNTYYNITGFPTAFFDGLNASVGGSHTASMYSTYLPRVNSRLAIPAHYTIEANGSSEGNNYTVDVTVAKPEADTNTNVVLHACLTESDIQVNWQGQTEVNFVNRLMIPSQTGTPVNLGTGESTTIQLNFTFNTQWVLANCELVFFLQNTTTKEILQGVKYPLPGLVGSNPVSVTQLDFPETFVNGTAEMNFDIRNFWNQTLTGTITSDNPAFTVAPATRINFSVPAYQTGHYIVSFNPTAANNYTGNLTIAGNIPNNPTIVIPMSGVGFVDNAPVATNVQVIGIPVVYQSIAGLYNYSDPDGDTEGSTITQWYRVSNGNETAIADAVYNTYMLTPNDIDYQIGYKVTPVDQHGMPGTPVMSTLTPVIENLPPPNNLQATVNGTDVVLTWQRPNHFEGRSFVGYRIFRDGLQIQTIANPATLTFTDTYVALGAHQYWVCSLFNSPTAISAPSNVVDVYVGTANDDDVSGAMEVVSVYPNPFSGSARIEVKSTCKTPVVEIFNLKGQLVRSFTVNNTADQFSIVWDGKDANGTQVNRGVYLYQVKTERNRINGKLIYAE